MGVNNLVSRARQEWFHGSIKKIEGFGLKGSWVLQNANIGTGFRLGFRQNLPDPLIRAMKAPVKKEPDSPKKTIKKKKAASPKKSKPDVKGKRKSKETEADRPAKKRSRKAR